PELLSPIQHSDETSYPDTAALNARDLLVKSRVRLINAIRGMVKSAGRRVPTMGADAFASRVGPLLPEELRLSLLPLVQTIAHLTLQIKAYDRDLETIAESRYPHTKRLRQVHGVGPVTALRFVLTIGDPRRFRKSREVGAYLGLTPGKRQSGESDKQMRISKAGSMRLRTLLVQCAQYALGRYGPDSDLKRWGTVLASRGGKNGKKRAIVATARKLAVLLHRLWITGEKYQPLFNAAHAKATFQTPVLGG
ncbi:MAG: IS110 family transposase, partial [Bradyrhizobium sp.]